MNENETSTGITKVGTVGVLVTDPDRALELYTGMFGFDKRFDVPFGNGARWIEVAPPGAETTIALVPVGSGQQLGIRFATEDADADHASLAARGAGTDPEVTRLGRRSPLCSPSATPTATHCSSSRAPDHKPVRSGRKTNTAGVWAVRRTGLPGATFDLGPYPAR